MTPTWNELSDFDARPGQSLGDHIEGVNSNISRLFKDAGTTPYGDDWQEVGRVLAWTHDAGKLTEWFQQYLDTKDRSVGPTPKHSYHGFVSALLTAHALHELDVAEDTRLAGFYAVAKHHGVLPDIPDENGDYNIRTGKVAIKQQYEICAEQLTNINKTAAAAADTIVSEATGGALRWEDVVINNPEEYSPLITLDSQPDDRLYETTLRAWSTLVCADKLDASGIVVPETNSRPSVATLREHVADLPEGSTPNKRRLNKLRTAAHEETKETIQTAHAEGNRLFRITLPTGFGKTLTGLRAGLEVANNTDGRVIYGLPYTSIIDQIDGEIKEIFDLEVSDREYTIHHHLADTWTRLDEITDGERVNDGSESLYAETWQSGLVLTTFVQLFESLAGPGNVQSMKLPALQDSVIIIDEPQALSLQWWSLIGRLTKVLREEYDAAVVLMTATQPEILERDPRLPDPEPLTSQFGECCSFIQDNPRVEFHLDDSLTAYLEDPDAPPRPVPEAANQLVSETVGNQGAPATLAIGNTIESAASLSEAVVDASADLDGETVQLADQLLEFYRSHDVDPTSDSTSVTRDYLSYLASHVSERPACLVATLTAQLRPIDRSILLNALRMRLDDDATTPFDEIPLITVSTQLIEAGVDISFDILYRDLGPVPALVQAAGRCNRNFGDVVSPVTVWRLAAPEGDDTTPSELIYESRSLLRPTRKALQKLRDEEAGTTIPEATMISAGVSEYYESLHAQRRTDARTSELVEYYDSSRGETLRNATLIDEYMETKDNAVLVSDADRQAYDTYLAAKENGDWQEADQAFDSLKQLFVSTPIDEESDTPDDSFEVVDLGAKSRFYEVLTGRGLTNK